jgi:AcrR family transcriptional regulator
VTSRHRSRRTSAERRTNAERTATTRSRVLDATARCLAEFGYARTTTTVVAKLAGVSRGALLHNFPTRSELVVAAARHLFDQRVDEVRERAATLPEGTDRSDAVIEMLFDISRSQTADASLEVISAGRTDPDLRPFVTELSQHYHRTIGEVFAELFPRPDDQGVIAYYEAVPTLFLAIIDGVTFQRAAGGPESDHHDQVLELTKLLGQLLMTLQQSGIPEEYC